MQQKPIYYANTMSVEIHPIRGPVPTHLKEEIDMLALQLNEIDSHEEGQKGKHSVNSPPDTAVAYDEFRSEISARLAFLRDSLLAHSIALAVDMDGDAIKEITERDDQTNRDRQLARRMNADTPDTEAPPPYTEIDHVSDHPPTQSSISGLLESLNVNDSDEPEELAGPSTYAERQEKVLKTLSTKRSQCCVCLDWLHDCKTINLPCEHCYCSDCLVEHLVRTIGDHTLFPPRCCRQNVPSSVIEQVLPPDTLEEFRAAEVEYFTEDRTYCIDCGKFIHPGNIKSGKATCARCDSETCAMCKNRYHLNDCPSDPALQATLALAADQGWQRCYKCRAMVELNYGCYHMT